MSQPTMSHRRAKTLRRFSTAAFAAIFFIVGLLTGGLELRAQEKNFLWKIESDKGTVYILGSIHLLKKDSPPMSALIDAAFDEAKRLVFEIDIVNEGPEKMQQLILQMGVNLDGKTLEQKVSKETYERAARWAKDLGIDIKMMSPLKPWVAGLAMLVMQLQKLGYDPNLGVDRQLAQRAKRANKPVAGLETSAFQISLFDGLPPRLQELMLRQSLTEMEQLEKLVDDMVRAWRSGDVAA
ncbi:MAG TPA: TraB/GumN family protein, partial [Candidatus Binatia bacterium]|nr:TraB/GumN family protein [Candidatus Binatia bacterium]